MLAEVAAYGIESACISHGSLRAYNRDKPWSRSLGWRPVELVRDCPVMPRWAMTGSATNSALLAAYLGQPVILRGHHQDLKGGAHLLDELAGFVNGIGAVTWGSMAGLSRMNFQWRLDGRTCRLRPLARCIDFQIPSDVERLIIERSPLSFQKNWRLSGIGPNPTVVAEEEPVTVGFSENMAVHIHALPAKMDSGAAESRRSSISAVIRRLLTETRDRLRIS
jgi:hypothetical protein